MHDFQYELKTHYSIDDKRRSVPYSSRMQYTVRRNDI